MSYLDKFKSLDKESFTLKGNYILVEKIEKEEVKTKSGLIIESDQFSNMNRKMNPMDNAEKPEFYRVILTGEGYSDGEPLEVDAGNIILLPKLSVKTFSHFYLLEEYKPDTIGLTTSSEAQMVFKDEDHFRGFFGKLNG